MKKRAGLVIAIAVVALLIVGVTGIATIQQRCGGAGDDTTGDNMPMGTTFAGIPIPGAAQPKEPGADAGEKETPDVVPGGDDPRGLDEFPVGVTPEGEPYHEGLVQVTFRSGVDEERIRAVCAEEGCAVRDMWKGTASPKKLTFVSASVLDGSSAEEKIAGFEQHDEVRSAGRSPVISFGSG